MINGLSEDMKRKIVKVCMAVWAIAIILLSAILILNQDVQEHPKKTVTGYITTISKNGQYTQYIELNDNYDRYEIENNIGTFWYQENMYQTHRITLWRGNNIVVFNNAIYYMIYEG